MTHRSCYATCRVTDIPQKRSFNCYKALPYLVKLLQQFKTPMITVTYYETPFHLPHLYFGNNLPNNRYVKTTNSVNSFEQTFVRRVLNKSGKTAFKPNQSKEKGSVVADRKVSPNWSQETMTCHSSNGFTIAWGHGNAPLVTSLLSSCYMTQRKG